MIELCKFKIGDVINHANMKLEIIDIIYSQGSNNWFYEFINNKDSVKVRFEINKIDKRYGK